MVKFIFVEVYLDMWFEIWFNICDEIVHIHIFEINKRLSILSEIDKTDTSFLQNWQPWSSHGYLIFWSFEESTPSIDMTVACGRRVASLSSSTIM